MARPRKRPLGAQTLFHQRLQSLVAGSTQAEFARKAGISQSGLNKILGGGDPSLSTIIALANAGGVSVEWLVAGGREDSIARKDVEVAQEFSFVPQYDAVRASAGAGAVVAPGEFDGGARFVGFRTDWLRRIGVNPQFAQVLLAIGDSMEPTIRDGDLLLIDRSFDRPRDNGIYVVVLAGMVLVKRIQTRRDGSVVLLSDNQRYEKEVVPAHELPDLKVEGRVRWFGRTI